MTTPTGEQPEQRRPPTYRELRESTAHLTYREHRDSLKTYRDLRYEREEENPNGLR